MKFCHPDHAKALRHEARLIRRLATEQFDQVVRLLHADLSGEHPSVMYEYVPQGPAGRDLGDRIQAAARLPDRERVGGAVDTLYEVCRAVAGVHRLGIVHRDLKPANILLDGRTNRLVIADFGIGYAAAPAAGADPATVGLTAYLRGTGTALYAGEPQRAGERPDPRDDVHALGVIAFQLLTAQLARGPGPDYREELGRMKVPPPLAALVGDCVSRDRGRQPADAGELLVRLDSAGTGSERPPPAEPQRPSRFRADFDDRASRREPPSPPPHRGERGPDAAPALLLAGLCLVLVVAVGGGLLMLLGRRTDTAKATTPDRPTAEVAARDPVPAPTPIPLPDDPPADGPKVGPKSQPKARPAATRPTQKATDTAGPPPPMVAVAAPIEVVLDGPIAASKSPDAATRDKGAGELARYLTHPEVSVRRRAARALAELGAAAVVVAPALREAVRDSDLDVRRAARVALDAISAAEAAAVAAKAREDVLALAKDFQAKEPAKRVAAYNAVARYGSEANVVGDKLIEAMTDRSPAVRNAAAEALARVNPKVHPHVMTVLYGKDKNEGFESLGRLKGEAAIAVPFLLGCQGELFRTGTVAGQPGPPLHGDGAFRAVAEIAPDDRRFAEAVLASVAAPALPRKFPDGRVTTGSEPRRAGLVHVSRVAATPAEKVTALTAALRDGKLAAQVVTELGELGRAAEPALPQLRQLRMSPDDAIRRSATEAVAKIE